MNKLEITTLGQLKKSGYISRSVKDELRANLIEQLKKKEGGFEGIIGFEDTVIPDLQTAILSRHNILLLGLRGQAKTRIARLLVNLLDEYVPYIDRSLGSEKTKYRQKAMLPLLPGCTAANVTPRNWLHLMLPLPI
jgi:magnesium chelatase subunit I